MWRLTRLRLRLTIEHNRQPAIFHPLQQRLWNERLQLLVEAERRQSRGKHKAVQLGHGIAPQVERGKTRGKKRALHARDMVVAEVKRRQSRGKAYALDAGYMVVAQDERVQRPGKFKVLQAADSLVAHVKECDSDVSFLVDDGLNALGLGRGGKVEGC